MKISIIIPAYNEGKRITPTLVSYYNFFKKKFNTDFEIIVVPNNCSDDTLEITEKFSKDKEQIRILNIEGYSGKGGAVIMGFKLARGDYVGFTDADNSTDPENFYKLYENKGDYVGIIASRKIKGASMVPKRKFKQNFSSFLFNRAVRALFGLKYKDTQCGAKLFTKDILGLLIQNFSETGWIFDVDFLHICKKNNLKILEQPITWKDAEGSKLTLKDGVSSFLALMKLRARG
jgi:glycosyltransferase involved in cell wall biosynthesis